MLSLILNGIKALACSMFPDYKYKYQENSCFYFCSEKKISDNNPVIIKSHADYHLFRKQFPLKKCIYIMRDGRDVMLSYYFYKKSFVHGDGYSTSVTGKYNIKNVHSNKEIEFDDMEFSDFLRKNLDSWINHVFYWKKNNNIYYLSYEELHYNFEQQMENICDYLALPIKKNINYVKDVFSNKNEKIFKKNNGDFYRKGIIGDWENYFSSVHLDYYYQRIRENNFCIIDGLHSNIIP